MDLGFPSTLHQSSILHFSSFLPSGCCATADVVKHLCDGFELLLSQGLESSSWAPGWLKFTALAKVCSERWLLSDACSECRGTACSLLFSPLQVCHQAAGGPHFLRCRCAQQRAGSVGCGCYQAEPGTAEINEGTKYIGSGMAWCVGHLLVVRM